MTHKHGYKLQNSPHNFYVFRCDGCLDKPQYVYVDKKLLRNTLLAVTRNDKEFVEAVNEIINMEAGNLQAFEDEVYLPYSVIVNWRPKERGPLAWLNKAAEKTADVLPRVAKKVSRSLLWALQDFWEGTVIALRGK